MEFGWILSNSHLKSELSDSGSPVDLQRYCEQHSKMQIVFWECVYPAHSHPSTHTARDPSKRHNFHAAIYLPLCLNRELRFNTAAIKDVIAHDLKPTLQFFSLKYVTK